MTYYDVLGVSPAASTDEIRSAYRKLAKQYHPDRLRKNATAEEIEWAKQKFRAVQEAYEGLTERRAGYDAELRRQRAATVEQAAAPTPAPSSTSGPGNLPFPTPVRVRRRSIPRSIFDVFRSFGIGSVIFVVYVVSLLAHYAQTGSWGRSYRYYPGTQTERLEGIIRDQSTNVSAPFAISIRIVNNSELYGCMAVDEPLFGSGRLAGNNTNTGFEFRVNSTAAKMTFTGTGREGMFNGTFRAVRKSGPTEQGTFTLGRVEIDDDSPGIPYPDCPTDEQRTQQ